MGRYEAEFLLKGLVSIFVRIVKAYVVSRSELNSDVVRSTDDIVG